MSADLPQPTIRLKKSQIVCLSKSAALIAQTTSRVLVWDTATRTVATQIKVMRNQYHLAISCDERILAIKNTNGEIAFCDPRSGALLSSTGTFNYRREGAYPAFTTDGRLVDGDWNGVLRIIDPSSAAATASHDFGFGYMFGAVESAANSKCFVAALNAKSRTEGGSRLLLYEDYQDLAHPNDVRPPEECLAIQGGWRHIDAIALAPSGTSIALALAGRTPHEPNTIVILELPGGAHRLIELPSRRHRVASLAWCKSGILCAAVQENTWQQGMTSAEYEMDQATSVYDHVQFFSIASGVLLDSWPWRGVCKLSASESGEALAIASSKSHGAFYASFDARRIGIDPSRR